MTPEQEAAREAALQDKLSLKERRLLQEEDDVPTLDDFEDDRSDPFSRLLDDLFEEPEEEFWIEEYDDERDYS